MNIDYRKSLLATAIAALIVAPGWAAAEQAQPSQPASGTYQQPMGGSGGSAGGTNAPAEQAPQATPSPSTQASTESGPFAKTPEQLDKMDVIGVTGEDLGKIKKVVRGRMDNDIYAVISSGGILGVGGRDVAVPLNELQLNGDKLQISATEEDLKAKPEYASDKYVELRPSDRPISEFSAFESGAPKGGGGSVTTQPR